MIEPLPIPTRLIGGEAVDSYATSHAGRNRFRAEDLERTLRAQGQFPKSKARSHPGRKAVWRALGGLHERAFTEPQTVGGNWVIDRPLCHRCGNRNAQGRRPDIGMVCVKHRRWLGGPQVDLSRFGEALVAERHWRRALVPRGIVVEAPVVLLAAESARVGLRKGVLEQRSELVSVPSPDLLVYPETVRLARLLSRPSFLDAVLGDAPPAWKRATVEREVRAVLPDAQDAENWRAVARVWDLVRGLHDVVRDARVLGVAPEDRWNLIRLWSGFAEFEAVEVSRIDQLM